MKIKNKKKKGFTLVEIMVGVALFSIVSMILVGIMSFSLRMNYTNKDSYDADSYSKAFFEALKLQDSRPPAQPASVTFNKTYKTTFNEISEVTHYALNEYKNLRGTIINTSVSDEINNTPSSSAEKIGMIINVSWNHTDKVYQIETWTWNLDKKESSLVNRKTLQMPASSSP